MLFDYCMSCSVLRNQIPQSLLFPQHPFYVVPPRVFGSTFFVHDLTPGRDKLSARAVKCVFLGYSRVQKRYKSYCTSTHHFHVSADVTLFEDTMFFASSVTSNSVRPSVLPVPLLDVPQVTEQDTSPPEQANPTEADHMNVITYERHR